MHPISFYSPIALSAETKKSLSTMMSESFVQISAAAVETFGLSKPKKIRDAYKADRRFLWFHPKAEQAMKKMIVAESIIMSGYIKLANVLCKKFAKGIDRPSSTYDDYLQQCAEALYDAMYMYNGSTKFATYARWAMRNKLVSYIRQQEGASGVSPNIQRLRAIVKKHMKDNACSFDMAIYFARNTKKMSDDEAQKVRDSMYRVCYMKSKDSFSTTDHVDDDSVFMWQAVREAPLSPMQRRLVEAHLESNHGFRKQVLESEINPNTGGPWTRARLSQLFIEAKQIICQFYDTKLAA